jgi:Amt family ammonium transporter
LQYFNDLTKAPAGAIEMGVTGMLYGNPRQFLVELIEGAVAIAWNVANALVIIWLMGKVLGSNRVPPEVEIAGLDIPEMGAPGYPEFIDAMSPDQVPSSEIAEARQAMAM